MSSLSRLAALAAMVCLVGAGCQPSPKTAQTPVSETPSAQQEEDGQQLPRQDVQPTTNAGDDFDQAAVVAGVSHKVIGDLAKGRSVEMDIPSSWHGTTVFWPTEFDMLNYIRAMYFTTVSAKKAWETEQPITELYGDVRATQRADGAYVMTANHKGLKVGIYKLYKPDPAHPESGYFLVECHVAHDAPDRADYWDACKTAMTSATFKTE
jgi:hypothetical protein